MAQGGHNVKERHKAGTQVKDGVALGDAESAHSIATTRYVIVGTVAGTENFCISKFGKKPDELPNVRIVTRIADIEGIKRDREFVSPVVMLTPGWSMQSNLASDMMTYLLAELDRRR